MELLLNLVWVFVCCLLVCLWANGGAGARVPGRAGRPALLPERRTQITALVLLIVILFPVISLTDDLMMSAAPAEVEHAGRLDLAHGGPYTVPQATPAVLAALALIHIGWDSWRAERLPEIPASLAHSLGFYRPVENRPPPAA